MTEREMAFYGKPRCHRFERRTGETEYLVVYGFCGDIDDDGNDIDEWPSYSVWHVPGTFE